MIVYFCAIFRFNSLSYGRIGNPESFGSITKGADSVNLSEDAQHILLLAITALLFIIFTTGLAVPSDIPGGTEVVVST
jgi:hypothetical protein